MKETEDNHPPAGGVAFALDFDGVLCDSATETGVTAWRAGQALWPAWQSAEPPAALLERFRQLRPLLETGFEAIPLLAWIDAGLTDLEIRARFRVGLPAMEQVTGRARAELIRIFGETRDRWIAADLSDWLARHAFFPGVVFALQRRLGAGRETLILTTKQERFARLLLEHAGVAMPAHTVYGLEQGRTKAAVVAEILPRVRKRQHELWLVEDRLPVLEQVADRSELASVQLGYALWGYGLPEEKARAAAHPRVQCLDVREFVEKLAVA